MALQIASDGYTGQKEPAEITVGQLARNLNRGSFMYQNPDELVEVAGLQNKTLCARCLDGTFYY